MIKLYNAQGIQAYPLTNIENFYITRKFGDLNTLCFDMSPKDINYKFIGEEIKVEYNNLIYNIKKINERKSISSIECELDVDSLKSDLINYELDTQSLTTALEQLLISTEWTFENDTTITIKRSISLSDVTRLDILNELIKTYGCYFDFDNKNNIIKIIDVNNYQPKGIYFTDELNLTSLEFKGDSSNFCTRLYAKGKKDENNEYLTFESINDGLDYVDNNEYCDKIISQVWIDERYTDIQSLKNDAIEKLKTLAIPSRSYTCNVVDMAKIDDKYEYLKCDIYDIVTLIDRNRNTRIKHRVVEYKEYPLKPTNNIITLSTVSKSVKGTINKVNTVINDKCEIEVEHTTLNEIKMTVDSNSMQIKDTYTRGETDTIISSQIQQSADVISSEVARLDDTNNEIKKQISTIQQSVDNVSINMLSTNYSNLLSNSCGLNGFESWNTIGNVSTIECDSLSGMSFIVESDNETDSSMSQTITTVIDEYYTFSCKAKGDNLVVTVNNIEYLNTKLSDEYSEISFVFKADNKNSEIRIYNIKDGITKSILTDTIINQGKNKIGWCSSDSEVYTTHIKIDDSGVEVGNNQTAMRTKMTHDAFKIYRDEDVRINVAPDGTRLQKTIIEDDLTVGTVKMIKRQNGADFVVIE